MKLMGTFSSSLEPRAANAEAACQQAQKRARRSCRVSSPSNGLQGCNTFWSLSLSPLIVDLDQGCGPALVKHQPLAAALGRVCVWHGEAGTPSLIESIFVSMTHSFSLSGPFRKAERVFALVDPFVPL